MQYFVKARTTQIQWITHTYTKYGEKIKMPKQFGHGSYCSHFCWHRNCFLLTQHAALDAIIILHIFIFISQYIWIGCNTMRLYWNSPYNLRILHHLLIRTIFYRFHSNRSSENSMVIKWGRWNVHTIALNSEKISKRARVRAWPMHFAFIL